MDDEYENVPYQTWDSIVERLEGMRGPFEESAGADNEYRNRALDHQIASAKAARENALKIAQLQASTSRYGVDVASRDTMAKLKENARQFDASHGLDLAKTYVQYSSTPDLMFARNDLMYALGRVGQAQGQGMSNAMPAPIASNPQQPQPKTYQDFAALASYNGSTVPGAGGGGGAGQAQSGGGGTQTDPRVSAASAVMKASAPSAGSGTDGQDWAALEAIRNIYSLALPGSLERLGPERQKIVQAGMARLGYDPNLVTSEYKRSLPGNQSPLLA